MGTGTELGPGVVLLGRTRLPGKQGPAMVGTGAMFLEEFGKVDLYWI